MTGIGVMQMGFRGRLILFLCLFAFLISFSSGTTIKSQFQCENTGETTYYSYLKQSDLKETGFARGLETGSLNYYKGRATIDDRQEYYDGKIDADHPKDLTSASKDYLHNSTVDHTLKVDYQGTHGLSLFYAKGFYNTNRAVSASKKIWFGNSTYLPTTLIDLSGIAKMDMGGKYLMDYNIKEANKAYFVFNDASGFSNKSGSRRIDFEQEGLVKGDISKARNYLAIEGEFTPRSGINDWLPCFCVFSLEPEIEGLDSPWPTKEIEYALSHPKEQENQTNVECQNCGCGTGLDCSKSKYKCEAEAGTGGPIVELPDLWVEAFYDEEESSDPDWSIYDFEINVKNIGTRSLEDVYLVAKQAFDSSNGYVEKSGSVDDVSSDPLPYANIGKMWFLGPLEPVFPEPDAKKTVLMKVKSSVPLEDSIKFYAIYRIGSKQYSTEPVSPIGEISREAY